MTNTYDDPEATAYMDTILEAAQNERAALLDGIKRLFNCRHADVDKDGNVWIEGPQTGHWLGDEGLCRIGRALVRGDI